MAGLSGGGEGSGEESPGPGNRFFPRHFTPCGEFFQKNPAKNGKFSSARKIFSCTIGEETRGNAGLTDEAHSGLAIVKYTGK